MESAGEIYASVLSFATELVSGCITESDQGDAVATVTDPAAECRRPLTSCRLRLQYIAIMLSFQMHVCVLERPVMHSCYTVYVQVVQPAVDLLNDLLIASSLLMSSLSKPKYKTVITKPRIFLHVYLCCDALTDCNGFPGSSRRLVSLCFAAILSSCRSTHPAPVRPVPTLRNVTVKLAGRLSVHDPVCSGSWGVDAV